MSEEVDVLHEKVRKFQQQDPRVMIKEYDDLKTGPVTVHAFYVKYLLPIWFDVQSIDWGSMPPKKSWQYA